MTYTRLVLFDIDGTLLLPDGIGREAMKIGLEEVFGTSEPLEGYKFIGQTDRETVSVLMTKAGFSKEAIAEKFDQLSAATCEAFIRLLETKKHNIRPCTGAPELVAALAAHPDALLGLVTGNVRPLADLKLRAVGYDTSLFRVGAFGDQSEARADLPPLALTEARDLSGVLFKGKQIAILGDTPADISCGRGLGARSISVATGWIAADELATHNPDHLFADFSDTQAVVDAIFAPV
jgi:phosphoglycolate phosphatase-like HAD superfamily hydrolase